MKKRLIGLAAMAALISAPALAADLPVKAGPPPLPAWSWTGCYFGGQAGGAFGYDMITDVGTLAGVPFSAGGVPGGTVPIRPYGWFGGGQVGCNYELPAHYVIGIEGDGGELGLTSNTILQPGTTTNTRIGINSGALGDVTGRMGLAVGQMLIYVKIGWAFYDGRPAISSLAPGFAGTSNVGTFNGYTVGGGFEFHLMGNWTAKLEYLHYGFENLNFNVLAAGGPFPFQELLRMDTIRLGVNYKFDWGGPVVARY